MKAQHTRVSREAEPHFEIQLSSSIQSRGDQAEHPTNLRRRGYNHLAFRVDDIEAATGI